VSLSGQLSFQYIDIISSQYYCYPKSNLALINGAGVRSSIISSNDATFHFRTITSTISQFILNDTRIFQRGGSLDLSESTRFHAVNNSVVQIGLARLALSIGSTLALWSNSSLSLIGGEIDIQDSYVLIEENSSWISDAAICAF
jgi:hypothetical protein